MGEMKNLRPGDSGWNFMETIRQHNDLLTRKERKLWSLMPLWRKLLWDVGFKRQGWGWFYRKRYLLWYIDDHLKLHDRPIDAIQRQRDTASI